MSGLRHDAGFSQLSRIENLADLRSAILRRRARCFTGSSLYHFARRAASEAM